MTKTALYPGSFDPFTNGHLDILLQALNIVDRVVIAIGVHAAKRGLFTFEERKELIERVFSEFDQGLNDRVSISSFDNLVVDAAKELDAPILIRGLRDSTDLNYEMQMAGMNGAMAPNIQTVFLPASPDSRPITATLVRQIAKMKGDISSFVPEAVAEALSSKFNK